MSGPPPGAELTRDQQGLVASVKGLVEARVAWHLARTRHRRRASDFGKELIAEGHAAVTECGRRYDAKHGASFATFARHRVDGAILDAMRKESRHLGLRFAADVAVRWGAHVHELPADGTLRPDEDDEVVADQKFRTAMRAKMMAAVLALAAEVDNLEREQADPEAAAALRPMREALRAERGGLAERQQQIVDCVYERGMDLRDAAETVGLAYPTVKVLHAKIMQSLRAGLEARGFSSIDGASGR